MLCIDKHIDRREGIPSSWVKYDTLIKDLAENHGFKIKGYKNPGDSPSLSLNDFVIWECKEGWAVAKVVDDRYTSHVYFNQGRVRHDDMFPVWTYHDLENAINYVLVLGGNMELLGDVVEAIAGIVFQFISVQDYKGYENGYIIADNEAEQKYIDVLVTVGKIELDNTPDPLDSNKTIYRWTLNSEYHSKNRNDKDASKKLMVRSLPKGCRLFNLLDVLQDLGKNWCYLNKKTLYNHDYMSVRRSILDTLFKLKLIEPIAPLAQEYIWSKTSKYFHLNPVSE
ncbi:MAG TPA: hypothetical protein VK203_27765 [Nostocaceae cyanobacterium]|nr:hypothetical protein [Nostocaceae cyanobacterium]